MRKFLGRLSKADRQSVRKDLGYTQTEIASMMGVSRSTVQRFEYGTGNNVKLKEFYSNADKFIALRRATMRDLQKLENAGVSDSPAMYYLSQRGGLPGMDTIEKGSDEIRRAIIKMKEFQNMKTKTVEGYEDWKKKVTKKSHETSGFKGELKNDIFWEVFNKIKNDDTLKKYYADIEFDSKQAIVDIKAKLQDVTYAQSKYRRNEIVGKLFNELTKQE